MPCRYAAPLHRIKTDDMLPLKLLTPFQVRCRGLVPPAAVLQPFPWHPCSVCLMSCCALGCLGRVAIESCPSTTAALKPFNPQAENDHHIKDTYNYVTVQVRAARPYRQLLPLVEVDPRSSTQAEGAVRCCRARAACRQSSHKPGTNTDPLPQTDVRMPKRHILQLEDSYTVSRFQQATEAAVKV